MRAVPALILTLVLAGCATPPAPAAEARPTAACSAGAELRAGGFAPLPGFGCATAANLALMVADPRDLQRGAEPGDPAGDAALAAVRRHQAGEARPLPSPADAGPRTGR
jgi:type IV pilus biogenesis protein CpaD/CtpE